MLVASVMSHGKNALRSIKQTARAKRNVLCHNVWKKSHFVTMRAKRAIFFLN